MWYRLIGGGLLLLCAGAWARERSAVQRTEAARVSALCDLLLYVGEQVAAYCMPLDEIAQNMPPDLAQRCGLHPEGIVRTVAESADQITDREAAAVLSRTAERLGRGEAEDQIALCRTAVTTLEACRDRLTVCAERDRRTRATLCMTGCLLVIILLW